MQVRKGGTELFNKVFDEPRTLLTLVSGHMVYIVGSEHLIYQVYIAFVKYLIVETTDECLVFFGQRIHIYILNYLLT